MALSKTKIKRRTNAYHNYKTLVERISYKCMMLGMGDQDLKMKINRSGTSLSSEEYAHCIDGRKGLKREIFRLRHIQGRRRIVNAGKIKAAISQY